MRKIIYCFFTVIVLGIPLLYAQEIERAELSTEKCIVFLYTGCPEEKLLAMEMLRESCSADKEVVEALIYCLHEGTLFSARKGGKITNDFWYVRAKSAELLGDIRDPQALTALHLSLRYDPDLLVKSCVAKAIGKIGSPDSIPHLARAIETSPTSGPDEIFVKACVEAVGEIGHKEGFWVLAGVIRSGYRRDIRLAAQEAMRKLQ